MRGIGCRGQRLEAIAGLVLALALPAAGATQGMPKQPTQTGLTAETHDQDGRTRATIEVTVSSQDGVPAAGAVAIEDGGRQLAGASLDGDGRATLAIDLAGGDHSLRAVYLGDDAHRGSVSQSAGVHADAGTTPDFSISVSPASLSLPLGQSGSVTASITPINNSSLTAPMFVTLSCSGLPDQSSCTFTPENIEILPTSCPDPGTASCPIKSTMVVETQLGTGALALPRTSKHAGPASWALVLPGALALVGLALRRRKWMGNLSLLVLLGAISMLGATACNSRYNYFNHGPPHNPPTPAGTYTLNISAQSSNGITAITHSTTMSLTVQ